MSLQQLSTFWIDGNLYGVDVQLVQEATKGIPLTRTPLAPNYIGGLMNLRGQIATAIGLRELFELKPTQTIAEKNYIICKNETLLMALIVDEIGDVLDVDSESFESTPETVPETIKNYISGVYKLPSELLSVIDIKKMIESINK